MADLNLFGSEGFQEPVVSEEAPPPLKQEEESATKVPALRCRIQPVRGPLLQESENHCLTCWVISRDPLF